jgi:hypothetical protein
MAEKKTDGTPGWVKENAERRAGQKASKAAKNAMKKGASPEKAAKVAEKFEANKKGKK